VLKTASFFVCACLTALSSGMMPMTSSSSMASMSLMERSSFLELVFVTTTPRIFFLSSWQSLTVLSASVSEGISGLVMISASSAAFKGMIVSLARPAGVSKSRMSVVPLSLLRHSGRLSWFTFLMS